MIYKVKLARRVLSKQNILVSCCVAVSLNTVTKNALAEEQQPPKVKGAALGVELVQVWGSNEDQGSLAPLSSRSALTPKDMLAINAATTEDLVKYEPSLVIRRRFIGDSNGTLGIRGSNMFQTSRSMVFADGVPLHYFLQSRWNGAPRWTMVSASEIAQVEVIYGPFSAEYSGNAMGGVVLIETAIPQSKQVHVDATYFNQEFEAYGFDDRVDGSKFFFSYGDKVEDASFYFSYNHLENTAQAQSFRDASISQTTEADNVEGAISGKDARGRSRYWYGDTGAVETTTDNLKFKVGYDFGAWKSLLNIAYEDRNSSNVGRSYLQDLDGETLWSGSGLVQDGREFSINANRLNANTSDRQSLSAGLRLKGTLSDNSTLELNFSRFDILNGENRSSALNPEDPNFSSRGQISDYDDSGWQTAEIKMRTEGFILDTLDLVTGLRHERYQLNLDVFDSPSYQYGVKGNFTSRFGGRTQLNAAFAQTRWYLSPQWELALGLRAEWFESLNGYFSDDDPVTAEFDVSRIPSEEKNSLSPKFSLAYEPGDNWQFRYSLAKATRFPIVEELFSQYRAYNTVALSNPELKPEEGLHHNLMINRNLSDGYVRLNIFDELVENAIESQTDTSTNVRSFVPIDEVRVTGLEFIFNQYNAFIDGLDLRANLAWTHAEIVDNSTAEAQSSNSSIEGKRYPRMPEWRGNILATYHLSEKLDISSSLQYASDSFGRTDNQDSVDNVFGAQDAYTRVGLKGIYRVNSQWNISMGVDNLSNEIAYVAHPWPGRTLYLSFSYERL